MSPIKTSANQRKAIAYIRVSSQRQVDEGVSIQAQKRRILEYVRYKKLNLANDDIIIEEGVSGGNPLWDRPKGRNLKRRLDTGQYTDIVTMKYGWDVNADGMFIPNWIDQDIFDYMAWQVEVNGMATATVVRSLNKRGGKLQGNSITRTIGNDFHTNRLKFSDLIGGAQNFGIGQKISNLPRS